MIICGRIAQVMIAFWLTVFCAYLALGILWVDVAGAQQYDIIADEIFFDDRSGEFRAIGNIILKYGDKKISADRIFYDSVAQIIRSSGHVIFQDSKQGTILFADKIIFDKNLNRQEIETVTLRLGETGLLRARYLNAESKTKNSLRYLVYSPCRECFTPQGKVKKPLWQIRSRKTLLDTEKKTLTHDDLYVDVRGKTVLYLPKLRHVYDNKVGLSGILPPIYGSNKMHKTYYAQPFYYRFSSAKDITVVPVYSHTNRHYFSSSYRTALSRGEIASHITLTSPKQDAKNMPSSALMASQMEPIIMENHQQEQESVFAKVHFHNQLTRYTRIRGNLHYLDNRNFFHDYRQNTDFNQHGVSPATYYQDDILIEQFIRRDYIRFETRYRHNTDPKESAIFPVAQVQYHGGIYRFAGGYVNLYGSIEELQRTEIETAGRKKISSQAQYYKRLGLRHTQLEIMMEYKGNKMAERNSDEYDVKFASRSIRNFYGRIQHDFAYHAENYTIGLIPELMSHHAVGDARNERFINEDTVAFIPSTESFLAFAPLGNGEDIQQTGRRSAEGLSLYYQYGDDFFLQLRYARAKITHEDLLTKTTLGIHSGKSDHAGALLISYKNFRLEEEILLASNDNRRLATNGSLTLTHKIIDFGLYHDRLDDTLFLDTEQRVMNLQQNKSEKKTEFIKGRIALRSGEFWEFSADALYDNKQRQFNDITHFNLVRRGDCVKFKIEYSRDYTNHAEITENIEFSLQLVN